MQEDLLESYLAIRDKKAALKAEYDRVAETLDQELDKMEQLLLRQMKESGQERIESSVGHALLWKARSAWVADENAFLNWLLDTYCWYTADIRASRTGMLKFFDERGVLPPGVKKRDEEIVRVFRKA